MHTKAFAHWGRAGNRIARWYSLLLRGGGGESPFETQHSTVERDRPVQIGDLQVYVSYSDSEVYWHTLSLPPPKNSISLFLGRTMPPYGYYTVETRGNEVWE